MENQKKKDIFYQNIIANYEQEIERLTTHIKFLEREIQRLSRVRIELEELYRQNYKLQSALHEAKGKIEILKEEVEKLTAPPSSYGVFTGINDDGTVNILINGKKMKVNIHPDIKVENIKKGQEIVLNEVLNVVKVSEFGNQGEVVRLKDILGENRAIINIRPDEERVAEIADSLKGCNLSVGDLLLFDPRSGFLLEKLPKSEIEEVVLEEIPNVKYNDIGGLDEQIEMIKDAVELPFLYPDLFKEHKLNPPKGVLLYGPPGCGKTLIAKAVATSIAERLGNGVKSYFLHVKGPELLNKYVGESERNIREVFKKAKEKADGGMPVIVFFDEMDALFKTRGSGISSDIESTIVPQFLSEIDGMESLRNVIVIGASNRQDLIDPAVLRPGRLDVKIKIDRPNEDAAKDIFSKYLTPDLPYSKEELNKCGGDKGKVVKKLIGKAVDEMYAIKEDNKYIEVTYANGEKEIFYFKDFCSGALIEGIVSRAKKYAIKRMIATKEKGIKESDIIKAIRDEYRENEDLLNITNPDDWARISGKRKEKIVNIRTFDKIASNEEKKVEVLSTGEYL
jgi:proteasome-associated ATPase